MGGGGRAGVGGSRRGRAARAEGTEPAEGGPVIGDRFRGAGRGAVIAGGDGGTGSVGSIRWAVGRAAGRGYLAYGTAKAALAHCTRLAAADLAPRIRVNAIAVGAVATSALDIVLTDDTLRGRMERATPLGRIGDPEDIAAAVLFLASPAGGYITGKIIGGDGGLSQPNLDLGLPDL